MRIAFAFIAICVRSRWAAYTIAATSWTFVIANETACFAESPKPAAVLQDLKSFRELGSVLLIAAHPDDENNQLITYMARARGYRMAYLSLTRGDGGQNVLGAEFSEELGVIRTQELLAARRIDGGRQFFTRAIDFGYSKDVNEALHIWDREKVLGDVVRIVRTFRPDVMITRFSPKSSGTHGHHTGSAVLGVEAFRLAGDPTAYPEQLDNLSVWQPKRVLLNGGGSGRSTNTNVGQGTVRIDIGGNDAVLGIPYAEIANRSRSMHKSQGFGNFGGRGGGGPRSESFQLLDGEPANLDIMDGVDATWGRIEGGVEIGSLVDDAIAKFNSDELSDNVPALLNIRSRLIGLPGYHVDPLVREKCQQLERIVQSCLGLNVETLIPQAEVVPGEALRMQHNVTVDGGFPVRWMGMVYPNSSVDLQPRKPIELRAKQNASLIAMQTLDAATPLSQPFWLREPGTAGMFRVDDPALIGQSENAPAFPIEFVFEVNGQTLRVLDEPVQALSDPSQGEIRRRMVVIPSVALQFLSEVRIFTPSATRTVELELKTYRANSNGRVELKAPPDWKVEPSSQSFELGALGDQKRFTFNVTAPNASASADILAHAQVNGSRYSQGRVEILYDHIPVQVLLPTARLKAVSLDLAIRGLKVGYISGAGDSLAEGLEQMGYSVSHLSGADLTPDRLRELDAVVVGVRAFNVRKDLVDRMSVLFDFVEAGGNVIEQYNRPDRLESVSLAPYRLRLSNLRVTDENAVVRFLVPNHPALNTPNKITVDDFHGWVQERGIYFPDQWDEHFTPILACNDPNEQSLEGGLLVAQHGKGYFIYTGLTWFRQLPAGVPGAYRLFANLVSLGK